jgi:hypothetical protein
MIQFFPEETKLVFFDLEYYIPEASRLRKTPGGLKFSPLLPNHRILGGTFQTFYPMLDRLDAPIAIWEWRQGSERQVLHEIFTFLQAEWRRVMARKDHGSLILCGIGISHSDVPALLARMWAYKISEPTEIWDILCGCRQIDLATAPLCQFSSRHAYFAYPKTKADLYQKYLPAKAAERLPFVWDQFDRKDFPGIEQRNLCEVRDTIAIYRAMFDLRARTNHDLHRLKRLDKLAKAVGASESGAHPRTEAALKRPGGQHSGPIAAGASAG